MSKLVDGLVRRFDSVAYKIFQTPPERLSFEEKAVVSAALAVIDKHMKDRRARITDLLSEAIEDGDTDGYELTETESGKSLAVDVPNVKLMRTVSQSKRSPDVKLMRELLESKGIEPEKVLKPKDWLIDVEALEKILGDLGVDKHEVMTPKSWEVDDAILDSLVKLGMLTEAEVEAASVRGEDRVTVRCTFGKDIQAKLLAQMEAMEADDGEAS